MYLAGLKLKNGSYISIGLYAEKDTIQQTYQMAISHALASAAPELRPAVLDFYSDSNIEIFELDIKELDPAQVIPVSLLTNKEV